MTPVSYYMSNIVVPNYGANKTKRDANIRYRIHKLLWKGFAHHNVGKEGGVQPFGFRVEAETKEGYQVMVQSVLEPNWQNVFGIQCRGVRQVTWNLEAGDHFYFRLHAAFKESRVADGKSKKYTVNNPNIATKKLYRMAERAGCSIEGVTSKPERLDIQSRKQGDKTDFWVNYHAMDGALVVNDPEAFAEVLVRGIGTSKYQGLGMFSIMR